MKTLEELLKIAEFKLTGERAIEIIVADGYASMALRGDGWAKTYEQYGTLAEKVAAALADAMIEVGPTEGEKP